MIKNKEKKKQKWKERKANTTQKIKSSCTHYKKDGRDDEHFRILHLELKPKKYDCKKKKTAAAIQKYLGSNSGDETTIAATGIKGCTLWRMQESRSRCRSCSRRDSLDLARHHVGLQSFW